MALNQLSTKNPDGNSFGQGADDKISFYGKEPIVQPVLASGADVAAIRNVLINLGLVRGS